MNPVQDNQIVKTQLSLEREESVRRDVESRPRFLSQSNRLMGLDQFSHSVRIKILHDEYFSLNELIKRNASVPNSHTLYQNLLNNLLTVSVSLDQTLEPYSLIPISTDFALQFLTLIQLSKQYTQQKLINVILIQGFYGDGICPTCFRDKYSERTTYSRSSCEDRIFECARQSKKEFVDAFESDDSSCSIHDQVCEDSKLEEGVSAVIRVLDASHLKRALSVMKVFTQRPNYLVMWPNMCQCGTLI
jgi:hypothetical protein